MTTPPIVSAQPTTLVILLGPPGTGKSTYGKRLAQDKGWAYLPVGALVRAYCTGPKHQQQCVVMEKDYEAGIPQPDEMAIGLLEQALAALPPTSGLIIDAFPLSLGQAHALADFCTRFNLATPLVLFIQSSEEVVLKRIASRQVCLHCNISYGPNDIAVQTNICPKCGRPLTHRADDKPEVVRRRYAEYETRLAPVRAYYVAQDRLVEIDGEHDLDTVYIDVIKALTAHNIA